MNSILKPFSVIVGIALLFFGSCRENFEFTQVTESLTFSKDTIFLDTVFTNIGSSTYTLKVYNNSTNNISIPQIALSNGANSKYRLNVDGLAGNSFENIPLLAKDSLFIFVETTFDIATTGQNEFLYTDAIRFGTATSFQEVPLVTLVKDAIFLYPKTLADGTKESLLLGLDANGNEIRLEGFILDDEELVFTKEKPYVIYGYAAVDVGKNLIVEAGARVHFHKNSGIIVGNGGSLQVNGTISTNEEKLENEVIFEGDRLEPEFSEVPGQWGTIWLTAGSNNNNITHLTIKNATIGILVSGDGILETPTLRIADSQIYNSSNTNFLTRTAWVEAQNCVFGNAGNYSLHCSLGGNYSFKHCTIANYWTSGFRNTPALLISNAEISGDNQLIQGVLSNALFANCIIDGNKDIELLLANEGTVNFNYQFINCSIKFRDANATTTTDSLYDFTNTLLFQNCIINPNVAFKNTGRDNFQLTKDSEVLNLGDLDIATEIPLDILGNLRTDSPDLGAFELKN